MCQIILVGDKNGAPKKILRKKIYNITDLPLQPKVSHYYNKCLFLNVFIMEIVSKTTQPQGAAKMQTAEDEEIWGGFWKDS